MQRRRKNANSGGKTHNSESQSDEDKDAVSNSNSNSDSTKLNGNSKPILQPSAPAAARARKKWSCIDRCCWFVGCFCSTWWFLLFLYNALPSSLPQYVTERFSGPMQDQPGVKLAREGLRAKHPVVFVPGIVTGGLELWEGHACADDLFRKRLWGGTFGELYKRYVYSSIRNSFVVCLMEGM